MGKEIFKDHYIKVGNINTRYWTAGNKGPVVIFLHGVGCHVEFWEKNISAFSKNHRVFAVDVVGYGRTDKPEVDYTFELMGNFVLDFMKVMNIKKASLVGNSMGGGISIWVASEAPEQVEKVVLVDPVGIGRGLFPVMRLMTLPFLGNILTKPGRKGVLLQMKSCLADPSNVDEDFIDRTTVINELPGNQRSFLSLLRLTADMGGVKKKLITDFRERISKIKSPILIIWGKQDMVLPITDIEAAVKTFDNARFYVIDQAGHCPQIDKPLEFNETVFDFLKK